MNIQPSLPLSEASANSIQINSTFTKVFKRLRNIKTESELLAAGVEIVHQVMSCDRAVVYSLIGDSCCQIVAEAVTPGYTQTLGMTIEDSCFETEYIEKYRKGRVRAVNDIYKSGLNPCHIKTLEKIEVKSNLIVPIVHSDRSLYGLLVMHQCSRERQWQQTEIAFILEISSWIAVQLQHQQTQSNLQSKLEKREKAQQLLTSMVSDIHGANSVREVLRLGVERGRETLNCDRVVIYNLQNKNLGKISAESSVPVLASILGHVIKDPCFEYRYIDRYQQGRNRSIANIFEAGMSDCYVDNLVKIGVKSNLVVPINLDNGRIYGLLVAHQCFDFKDWQPEEIERFQQIAFHTGLSLSKANAKQQYQTIKPGLERLEEVKKTIALAQQKIQQIEKPFNSTSQISIEIYNFNKLLEREMEQIYRMGSGQTKKDIKVIQIIVTKLTAILTKLRHSLSSIDSNSNEADAALEQALGSIDSRESVLSTEKQAQ